MSPQKELQPTTFLAILVCGVLYIFVLFAFLIFFCNAGKAGPWNILITMAFILLPWPIVVPFGLRLLNGRESIRDYVTGINLKNRFLVPGGLLFVLLTSSCGGLRDLSSQPVGDPLAAFPGKYQVLIYWDAACPYCDQQLAEVETVYDRWSGMGIILVAIDVGDPQKIVMKTVEKRDYSFPVLSGAKWDDLETHSVPYTIIHVDGKVVGHWIGYFSVPDIENMLMGDEP